MPEYNLYINGLFKTKIIQLSYKKNKDFRVNKTILFESLNSSIIAEKKLKYKRFDTKDYNILNLPLLLDCNITYNDKYKRIDITINDYEYLINQRIQLYSEKKEKLYDQKSR